MLIQITKIVKIIKEEGDVIEPSAVIDEISDEAEHEALKEALGDHRREGWEIDNFDDLDEKNFKELNMTVEKTFISSYKLYKE